MKPVTRKVKARVDLLEQFNYFVDHGGIELADRYFTAVEMTCRQLAAFPLSGAPYLAISPALNGVRRIPVTGFENYLIFYMVNATGIDVIRVLHGARDIDNIFAEQD